MRSNNNQFTPGKSPSIRIPASGANGTGSRPLRPVQRNLRDYFLMIRERWLLGLATAVILVGLLVAHQLRQPKIYESRASLIFETSKPQVVDIQEVLDTSLNTATIDATLQTHIGQIKSVSFFQYVAETFTEEEKEQIQRPRSSMLFIPSSIFRSIAAPISSPLPPVTAIPRPPR